MDARALTENLAALLRREHDALAEFLVALADFDRRRLWVEMGHASLFYYLHRELRLSKGAAQYRKVAAELIQQVPDVVAPLRQGDLCLSSIIEAAKVVTPENWQAVLPRFYGLSRREAMEVVAELQPHPAPPERMVITPVPTRRSSEVQAVQRTAPDSAPLPLADLHEDVSPETSAARASGWPVDQPEPATGWPVNRALTMAGRRPRRRDGSAASLDTESSVEAGSVGAARERAGRMTGQRREERRGEGSHGPPEVLPRALPAR